MVSVRLKLLSLLSCYNINIFEVSMECLYTLRLKKGVVAVIFSSTQYCTYMLFNKAQEWLLLAFRSDSKQFFS